MSETHPSFLMAESSPGPGWQEARPADAPSVVSLEASDDPQKDFEKLAELWAKTHKVSLAEGYQQVSIQAPTLYERAKKRAELS